jgi:hypothetical protein
MEDCTHEHGTYNEKRTDYKRCNACGMVMNVSKKEFDSDNGDDGFFDDDYDDDF